MTMTSEVAALRIARDLKMLEDAIDNAIAAQCGLALPWRKRGSRQVLLRLPATLRSCGFLTRGKC